jgi:hypothetical protein
MNYHHDMQTLLTTTFNREFQRLIRRSSCCSISFSLWALLQLHTLRADIVIRLESPDIAGPDRKQVTGNPFCDISNESFPHESYLNRPLGENPMNLNLSVSPISTLQHYVSLILQTMHLPSLFVESEAIG